MIRKLKQCNNDLISNRFASFAITTVKYCFVLQIEGKCVVIFYLLASNPVFTINVGEYWLVDSRYRGILAS